jgi:hypothetical protein
LNERLILMTVIEHQFRALREQTESLASNGLDEVSVRQAVTLALSLWAAARQELAELPAESRTVRSVARAAMTMLRSAEQLLVATTQLATVAAQRGLHVRDESRLASALHEVRGELLMPMAGQMAQRDPQRRSAQELRDILLARVAFNEGRPVITEHVTVGLPNPLEPEPNL